MKYQLTLTIAAAFGFAAVQSAVAEYAKQEIFPDPKETNGVIFFSEISVTKGSNLRSHISADTTTDPNLAYVPESISTVLKIDGVSVNTTVASVVGIEVTTAVSSVDRAPLSTMVASVDGVEVTTTVFSVDGGSVSSTVEGKSGIAPKDGLLSIPITQIGKADGTTVLMLRAGKGSMALKSATSSLINEEGSLLASPGVDQSGILDSKTNVGVFKEAKTKKKSLSRKPSSRPSNIPSKKPLHNVGKGGIPNSKSKNGGWSKMKNSKSKQMFPKRKPPSMPSKKPSKIPSKKPNKKQKKAV